MAAKVELQMAFFWHCDECGAENFARAVVTEMLPEDITDLKQRYGGDDEEWLTGNWVGRPEEVTCQDCKRTFETEDWESPSKEEDND